MSRRRRTTVLLAVAPLAFAPTARAAEPSHTASASITVDFSKKLRDVSPYAFGVDVTGYGSGSYITNDAAERTMLKGRYGLMRLDLKFAKPGDPSSPIVAAGAGADTTIGGDAWVSAVKSLGAQPVVIVPTDPGDAAALVRHFNTGPAANRVARWIIGSEPDGAGQTAAAYADVFNRVYDAMKAVDPTIKIGGPGAAWPNLEFLKGFLAASGSRVDFVDFHKYGMGDGSNGSAVLCDADLLAQTGQWETDVKAVRSLIAEAAPRRAAAIEVEVGEMNSAWGVVDGVTASRGTPDPHQCQNIGTEPVQYRNAAVWWAASAWGHLLDAGGIGLQYGDKNGALGLLYDQADAARPGYAHNGAGMDERMPVYQGLGFFTGEAGTGLTHFGTALVASSTELPGVEVYASSDPDVVVIVNKGSAAYNVQVSVGGGFVSAKGFQKDGSTVSYALPTSLGTLPVTDGHVTVSLAGPSVTQLAFSRRPAPPRVTKHVATPKKVSTGDDRSQDRQGQIPFRREDQPANRPPRTEHPFSIRGNAQGQDEQLGRQEQRPQHERQHGERGQHGHHQEHGSWVFWFGVGNDQGRGHDHGQNQGGGED